MSINQQIANIIGVSWAERIGYVFDTPIIKRLMSVLRVERQKFAIYPDSQDVFNALKLCPFDKVKVIIMAQDPYHTPDVAHGLAFSSKKQGYIPPSLQNIFKEIKSDIVEPSGELLYSPTGDLTSWAEQGVLLLNRVLTVRGGLAGSHQNIGWEFFTDAILKALLHNQLKSLDEPYVYMLWGAHAQTAKSLIDPFRDVILEAPHPSPLSAHRGFLGCKHFSLCNSHLIKSGQQPINWV